MCGYCQRSDGRRRLGPFPSFGLPKNLGACRGLHLSWAGICVLDRDIRTACITGLPALNLDKPPRSAQLGVEATHNHKQFRSARCRTSRALTSWMRRRAEEEESVDDRRNKYHRLGGGGTAQEAGGRNRTSSAPASGTDVPSPVHRGRGRRMEGRLRARMPITGRDGSRFSPRKEHLQCRGGALDSGV